MEYFTVPFSYALPNGDRLEGRGIKVGSAVGVVQFCNDRFIVGNPIEIGGNSFVIEKVEPRGESIFLSLRPNLEI